MRQRAADAASTDQVIQILQQVRAMREQGAPVDEDGIIAQHPRIGTRLKRGLEHLRRIEAAEEAAAIRSSTAPLEGSLDDERQFLDQRLTDYLVGERLRSGGQGVVYRAVRRGTGEHVAIKLLVYGRLATRREQHRFEREVDILSRLKHANIVSVEESGCIERRQYVVTPFIDGVSIDTFVVSDDLTVRGTVQLFVTVCRAIEYAHQRGVIHRDIKPDNLLVNAKGVPFVLDFGLAKDVTKSAGPCTTLAGERVGTPAFFSPEQASDTDSDVDVRSDVYSLGVTLFVLIAQAFPYPMGGSAAEARRIVLVREPSTLRAAMAGGRPGAQELNDDLERIVRKALAKEKERRYASVGALADDLERYLRGEAVLAKADSALYVLRKTVRRYRLLVGAAAFLCITLGASTMMIWKAQRETALERDRARDAARLAHKLFADSTALIEERLPTLAGGLPIREGLVDSLRNDLPKLLDLVEADLAMRDVQGAVREQQGDMAYERGRYDEARLHYEAVRNGSADGSLAQARSHRKLGRIVPSFDTDFQHAVRIDEAIVAAAPNSLEPVIELCEARLAYARRLLDGGRASDANAQIEPAVRALESVTAGATESESLHVQSLLARAYSMRAEVRGGGASAIADSRKASEIRRKLSNRHPANVEVKHELLLSLMRLAGHSPDDADALFEEATTTGDYLQRVEPRTEWLVDVYSVFDRAGQHALQSRRYDAALEYGNRGLAVAKLLDRSEPDGAVGPRALAYAHDMLGRIEQAREQRADAIDYLNGALQCWERVLSLSSETSDMEAAAATHDALGSCLLSLGRGLDAIQSYQTGLSVRERAYGSSIGLPAALGLSQSMINLSNAHRLCAPAGEARRLAIPLLDRAERLLDQAAADSGHPPVEQRRTAITQLRELLQSAETP